MSEANNVIDFFKYFKKPEPGNFPFDEYGFTPLDYQQINKEGGPIVDNDMWAQKHMSEVEETINILVDMGMLPRDAKYEQSNDYYHITIVPPEANNS